ncbi:MAG: hypothetical protein HQL88_01520 [Magnetococcales bacterium]|nr:hypothetical protein [Magnetococcales bacterium]
MTGLMGLMVGLHIFWHGRMQQSATTLGEPLPAPPPIAVWRWASLGEPVAMARLSTLWLQACEYQPGESVPLRDRNFQRVEAWLDGILTLDPKGQYPLQMAARRYAETEDPVKQRQMLAYISRQFAVDPDRRWPWLAHAALLARHRLQDLPLALTYARAIRARTTPGKVPSWARQMEWVVLEEMGELEGTRLLIGGLLSSGEVTSPAEIRFLNERLRTLAHQESGKTSGD